MKKKLLAAAGMLLTVSMALPSLANSSGSLVGDWTDQDSAQNLLDDVIYDGTPVSTSDAIAKVTYGMVSKRENDASRCSATLIDERIMLTAAHCVGDTLASQIFVEYYSSITKSYQRIQATQLKVNPEYAGKTGENDVAIFQLATSIPGSSVALLPKADLQMAASQNIIVAGLGLNKIDGTMAAIKQLANLAKNPEAQPFVAILKNTTSTEAQKKDAKAELLILLSRNPLLMTLTTATPVHIDSGDRQATQMGFLSQGGHSVCEGDSGGPSFVKQPDGRLVILGVHSASTNPDCNGARLFVITRQSMGVDTFVPSVLDWIELTVKSMNSLVSI